MRLCARARVCACARAGSGSREWGGEWGGSVALHGGDEGQAIGDRGEPEEDEMVESSDLGGGFRIQIPGPLSHLGHIAPPLQASISFLNFDFYSMMST